MCMGFAGYLWSSSRMSRIEFYLLTGGELGNSDFPVEWPFLCTFQRLRSGPSKFRMKRTVALKYVGGKKRHGFRPNVSFVSHAQVSDMHGVPSRSTYQSATSVSLRPSNFRRPIWPQPRSSAVHPPNERAVYWLCVHLGLSLINT